MAIDIAQLKNDSYRIEGTLNDTERQRIDEGRWSESYARRVTVQEFGEAQTWRKANHDRRWDEAERLYLAVYPQLTWPGSKQPRSSLGVPITFEQIEAMKPRIISAIFPSGDDWFECDADYGTTPAAARGVTKILNGQFCYSNPREVVRRSVHSALLFGNGIMELFWDRRTATKQQFVPQFIQKKQRIVDPITGRWINMPTGEFEMKMVDKKIEQLINRPAMRNVSLRDFFIDPHTPGPVPGQSRYCQKRIMMPIDDILALSKATGFDVPDKMLLLEMFNQGVDYETPDQSRQNAQALQGVSYNPTFEYTPDGRLARVEVLIRWSGDRLIWVVGKAVTIYNHPNPFGGIIPYYNLFYADMSDRFYGLSVADVVEGEQRFQQRLVNARLDELSLGLEPPTVMLGGRLSTFELRYRPGNVAHIDTDAEIQRQFPNGITNQAFMEQQQSDIRVQRITGQNESIMQGVPTAQNPLARSASGANMQMQASMGRLIYIVENTESLALEPMAQDAWELNKLYMSPTEMQQWSQELEMEVEELFNANVRPKVRAGSRMASKQALAQVFPLIMQAVGNGPVMAQMAMQGQTIDWMSLFHMLFDITGYTKKVDIIRPMNEEEKAAMEQQKQQAQQADQMKLQMQRERMEAIGQNQMDKGTMDFVKEVAKIMMQNRLAGREIGEGVDDLIGGMGGGMMRGRLLGGGA